MNKEQIYDEQISPLMKQIIAICKECGIATTCTFAIPIDEDPELVCSTRIPDGNDEYPAYQQDIHRVLWGGRQPFHFTVENPDGTKEFHAVLG